MAFGFSTTHSPWRSMATLCASVMRPPHSWHSYRARPTTRRKSHFPSASFACCPLSSHFTCSHSSLIDALQCGHGM